MAAAHRAALLALRASVLSTALVSLAGVGYNLTMQHGPSLCRRELRCAVLWLGCLVLLCVATPSGRALEPAEATQLFIAGDYQGCIRAAEKAVSEDDSPE